MNDEYSLNGRLKTPIGLIECICIINALHHHSGIDRFGEGREGRDFSNSGKEPILERYHGRESCAICESGFTQTLLSLNYHTPHVRPFCLSS